jgi:acylphosphatase
MSNNKPVVKHLKIEGRVQGVGFRYFTRKTAQKYSVKGWVKNMNDGTVEAVLAGQENGVLKMMDKLRSGPASAHVTGMKELPTDKKVEDFHDFSVHR